MEGDGEAPHAAECWAAVAASAGHSSPGPGVHRPGIRGPMLAPAGCPEAATAPALGAGGAHGALQQGLGPQGPCGIHGVWAAASWQGRAASMLVSDQFGQKPNAGRNCHEIPAEQPPNLTALTQTSLLHPLSFRPLSCRHCRCPNSPVAVWGFVEHQTDSAG